jgi:hypothetical protein
MLFQRNVFRGAELVHRLIVFWEAYFCAVLIQVPTEDAGIRLCGRSQGVFHVLGHEAMSIRVPRMHPQEEFWGGTSVILEVNLRPFVGGCTLRIEKCWD